MTTEELKKYVRESFVSGKTVEDIQQALLGVGWQEIDIHETFQELGNQLPRSRAARYVVTARHQTESDARGVFLYTFDLGF